MSILKFSVLLSGCAFFSAPDTFWWKFLISVCLSYVIKYGFLNENQPILNVMQEVFCLTERGLNSAFWSQNSHFMSVLQWSWGGGVLLLSTSPAIPDRDELWVRRKEPNLSSAARPKTSSGGCTVVQVYFPVLVQIELNSSLSKS